MRLVYYRMTRHARNCTAGTVYTYHERQKDTKASGYGTQKLRVGKDSVKVNLLFNSNTHTLLRSYI